MRWLVAAVLGVVATAAFATAEEPHFAGRSRDGHDVTVSLVGGAFVGQSGPWMRVVAPVQVSRRGRAPLAGARCLYAYQPNDATQARIECAVQPGSPLSGVVYTRRGQGDAVHCTQRCGPAVPAVLHLHEDHAHR